MALALVLGGLNRFLALPRLRRTALTMDAHTFTNVLYLEALAMIGVFIAAAALAHSVPAYVALGWSGAAGCSRRSVGRRIDCLCSRGS